MKRIVIDTDPGIDDAQAIMMAYMHPNVKIEAITSVAGNVGIEHTTVNVLKILDVLEAESIPVFSGAHSALVETGENASSIHGENGLGDVAIPESDRKVENEPAALALSRLGKENPGELELIAIGPLTNIALALRLNPDLPSLYNRLVIMGGAYLAQGNTANPPAEFNIFADPEAAYVVFENWPGFTMVSWEATVAHGMPIDEFTEFFAYDNPRSKFLEKVTQKTLEFLKLVLDGRMNYAADPLAMAVLMEPEIVLESEEKFVQIERFGSLSRGMTVVDWWNLSKQPPNVNIIRRVDSDRFFELLKMAFE
jgi:purine nucleosidase